MSPQVGLAVYTLRLASVTVPEYIYTRIYTYIQMFMHILEYTGSFTITCVMYVYMCGQGGENP